MLPVDRTSRAYAGYIAVCGQNHALKVGGPAPAAPPPRSPRPTGGGTQMRLPSEGGEGLLELEPALAQLLRGREPELERRLHSSRTALEFLEELCELAADRAGPNAGAPAAAAQQYCRIVAEVEAVGWGRIGSIDGSLAELTLVTTDPVRPPPPLPPERAAHAARAQAGRSHSASVRLPAGYPREPPTVAASLPAQLELRWGAGSTLADVAAQFEAAVAKYQPLWDELAVFDAEAYVLEPSTEDWGCRSRRVVLDSKSSMLVVLDAAYPRQLPEARFLGCARAHSPRRPPAAHAAAAGPSPDHATAPLRAQFGARAGEWRTAEGVKANLERILGVTFLPRSHADASSFELECAVCYAYELEGAIPDTVCDEPRCCKPFHRACLFEYFRGLPNARQSFGTFFGPCPYCSAPMNVKAG